MQRLPGWDPNSWGYHGDDGNSFNCSGSGKKYGPTFTTGDVIGCGVDFARRSVFFTKNGVYLGIAFDGLPIGKVQLFPCIGLRTPGEIVEMNFGGRRPFAFDICSYVAEQIELVQSGISRDFSRKLDEAGGEIVGGCGNIVIHLILKHLLFNGYIQSAECLAQSVGNLQLQQTDIDRSRIKFQMLQMLERGEYDDLLDFIKRDFSDSGGGDGGVSDLIVFRLKCQKFVDLVKQAFTQATTVTGKNNSDRRQSSITSDNGSKKRQTRSSTSRKSTGTGDSMQIDSHEQQQHEQQELDEYERIKCALDYGQKLQDEYRSDDRESVQQKLIEIFSVLAYPNPLEVAPINHLFDSQRKTELFDELNSELFGGDDLLRRSMKQLQLVISELHDYGDGTASLVDSRLPL